MQSTPKHPAYEEPIATISATESLVGRCYEEAAESDQGSVYTDEGTDEHHFCDFSTENDNDEILAHGLDMGITDTQIESQNDKLIYPNARITNATSMLLIMTFAVIHKLSGEALKDLLTLIDMHCLIPHGLIQSLYKFKKYFSMLKHPIKRHHYCSSCCMPVDLQCSNCPNSSCEETFAANNDKPFFIEIPIIDQLKVMFNRKGFYSDLKTSFSA